MSITKPRIETVECAGLCPACGGESVWFCDSGESGKGGVIRSIDCPQCQAGEPAVPVVEVVQPWMESILEQRAARAARELAAGELPAAVA